MVTLSLLGSIQHDLAAGRSYGVVDIERATGLNLITATVRFHQLKPLIEKQYREKRTKGPKTGDEPQSRMPPWHWPAQRWYRSMPSRSPQAGRSGQLRIQKRPGRPGRRGVRTAYWAMRMDVDVDGVYGETIACQEFGPVGGRAGLHCLHPTLLHLYNLLQIWKYRWILRDGVTCRGA